VPAVLPRLRNAPIRANGVRGQAPDRLREPDPTAWVR
jgi:hypothetical protein